MNRLSEKLILLGIFIMCTCIYIENMDGAPFRGREFYLVIIAIIITIVGFFTKGDNESQVDNDDITEEK